MAETDLLNRVVGSTILRDTHGFLLNLKSFATALKEKRSLLVNAKEIDQLRRELTLCGDQLEQTDHAYTRLKIMEGILKLRNLTSLDHFDLNLLPFFLGAGS